MSDRGPRRNWDDLNPWERTTVKRWLLKLLIGAIGYSISWFYPHWGATILFIAILGPA